MEKVVIGNAELYLGDCMDILPTLGKVDALITDPPYGIGVDYGVFKDISDNIIPIVTKVIDFAKAKACRMAMTPGQKLMFKYPEPDAIGVFYYPAGTGSCSWGFVGWQPIFYYGKCPFLANGKGRRTNSTESTESAEKNGHPCPKPIKQMQWLVYRASLVAETVLDPFMGSGTTGVACMNLDRKFIGIEIDERYFRIACERIAQAQQQLKLAL